MQGCRKASCCLGGFFDMLKLIITLLILFLSTSVSASTLSLGWDYVHRIYESGSIATSQLKLAGSNVLDWETRFLYGPQNIQLDQARVGFALAGWEHYLSWGYALPHFKGRMSIVGGNVQQKQDYGYTITGKIGPWSATGIVARGISKDVQRVLAGQLTLTTGPWQFLATGSVNHLGYLGRDEHMYVLEGKYAQGALTLEGAMGATADFQPARAAAAGMGYTSESLSLRLNYRDVDGNFVTPAKSSFALGRGRTGWDWHGRVSLGWLGVIELEGSDLTSETGNRQCSKEIGWSASLGISTLRVGRAWSDSSTRSQESMFYGLKGKEYDITLTQRPDGWHGKLQFSPVPRLEVKAAYDTSLQAVRIQGDLTPNSFLKLRGLVRRRGRAEALNQCFISLTQEFGHFKVELDWGTWDNGRIDAYWQHPSSLGVKVAYQRRW
jgi:hypothetical protein